MLLAELYHALRRQVPRLVVRAVRTTKLQIAGRVAMAGAALEATTALNMKQQLKKMDEAGLDYDFVRGIVADRAKLLRPSPLDASTVTLALRARFRESHQDAVTLAAIFLGQHFGYGDAARAQLTRESAVRIGLPPRPEYALPPPCVGGRGGAPAVLELVPLDDGAGASGSGSGGDAGGPGGDAAGLDFLDPPRR